MEAKIRKNDRSELWLATAYTNSMTQAIVAMSMNQTNIFNIDFNPPLFRLLTRRQIQADGKRLALP